MAKKDFSEWTQLSNSEIARSSEIAYQSIKEMDIPVFKYFLNFANKSIVGFVCKKFAAHKTFNVSLRPSFKYFKLPRLLEFRKLELKADIIYLSFADNGIGITLEQLNASNSFGIIGMRERANQINGEFAINTQPGKGTKITVSFSIKQRLTMNILIADNHSVVLEGLKHILKKLPDIEHEEEVTNGIDANKMIENNVYDFVILDISLLGMSGLDILKILKIKNNITHILILSMHPEEQYAVQALKLWVKGYVTKKRAGEELLAAIKKISYGGKYVSPELAEYMASNFDYNFEKALHQKLGEREFQIMILHAKGKTSREIATELFISEKTVGTHHLRIMQKMGIKKKRSYFLCY